MTPLKETLPPDIIANWRTHIAYLRGPLRAAFDMRWYDDGEDREIARTNCGTVGCNLGHASLSVRPKLIREGWGEFSAVVFGDLDHGQWHWCFGGTWTQTDNTPTGAADRMECLLERGLPENWQAQMSGTVALCYREAQ